MRLLGIRRPTSVRDPALTAASPRNTRNLKERSSSRHHRHTPTTASQQQRLTDQPARARATAVSQLARCAFSRTQLPCGGTPSPQTLPVSFACQTERTGRSGDSSLSHRPDVPGAPAGRTRTSQRPKRPAQQTRRHQTPPEAVALTAASEQAHAISQRTTGSSQSEPTPADA